MKRARWAVLLLVGYAGVHPVHAQEKYPLARLFGTNSSSQKVPTPKASCDCQTIYVPQQPLQPVARNRPQPVSSYNVFPDPDPGHQQVSLNREMVIEQDKTQEAGMVRVNSKHIQFNYDIKNIGPSGIMGVELYYTRDGQTWAKSPTGMQRDNPYYIEVAEEGIYGFSLIPRTGFGGGQDPPTAGDPPQVWVEVDVTKPIVFITGTQPGAGSRTLTINWKATDKNLGRRPISLYFSDQAGQWLPITTNLENIGEYTWQIPPSIPSSFRVRVEATDLAGNMGSVETPNPILIDLAQPNVATVRVRTLDK